MWLGGGIEPFGCACTAEGTSLCVVLAANEALDLVAGCEVGRTERPLAGVVDLELSTAALLVPFVIRVNSAASPPDP